MPTPTIHTVRKTFVASLWLGVLGSPTIWAIHLQLLYSLVKVADRTHHYFWLYATTAICAALTAGCAAVSWRDWRSIRRTPPDTESSAAEGRTRFLGLMGMCGSAFFTVVILATGLATGFFRANWE